MKIVIDKEFESLIFPLTKEELSGLEEDILKQRKCYDSIKVWQPNGKDEAILCDGHNRYKICQKHKIEDYRVTVLKFDDREEAKIWIIMNQLHRRNLSDFQRIELATVLRTSLEEKAHKNRSSFINIDETKRVNTRKEIAKVAKVSEGNVYKVEKILEEAPKKIIRAARNGDISINQAHKAIKPDLQKPHGNKRVMMARDCFKVQYGMVDLNGNFTRGSTSKYFTPPEDSQEGIDLEWLNGKFDGAAEEVSERYAVKRR